VPRYRNKFLDLARLGAVAEGAAEAFFRSEIRRRLAVTAVLIVLSRVGYFVPLPGFDRRLIPDSYLSFAPLPAGPSSSRLLVRAILLALMFMSGSVQACHLYNFSKLLLTYCNPSSMQMTSLILPLS
jgi:hypothetical protein